jgi:uncharacterized membrane protein
VNRALATRLAILLVIVLSTSLAVTAEVQSRFLGGKVLDTNDQAVPKAIVYLKNTKTLVIKTYIADQDGSYHFPGLSQNLDYEVYAESNGKRSDVKSVSSYDTHPRLNINLHIDTK